MRYCRVILALIVTGCGGGQYGGPAAVVECVPYARQVSGIQLYGDAAEWWDEAAGRYLRSTEPVRGGVLVFRSTNRIPHGHVSVVVRLRSAREILVDHANWVRDHIGRDEPVVDVSPGNDWSAVRVWWPPTGQLGATVYPTYGFVLPSHANSDRVANLE